MGTIFYTADWHLLHARIIDLSKRPFANVNEMNQTIIDNCNAVAGEDDELYFLGDVCMGKLAESLELMKQVKARKILVPGNHDRMSRAYQRKGDIPQKCAQAAEVYKDAFDVVLLETPTGPSVWPAPGLQDDDWPITYMSHYPYVGDSHGDERYGELRPADLGSPLIHGHVHEEWHIRDKMFNVGVDVNNFTPVHVDVLRDWVASV